ncbi:hypothetical protein ACQEVS_18635 [Streptomyces sp. CA-181903]|uniref:hypothetical protein n=1 Tax=Streptomyces sp. CA-181903 TaxID=3240055 RepID=UPI003D8D532F
MPAAGPGQDGEAASERPGSAARGAHHAARSPALRALGGPRGVRVRRTLTTAAATALLGLGGVALATPAQAEADVHLLGGVADAVVNRTIGAQLLRTELVRTDDPLRGII